MSYLRAVGALGPDPEPIADGADRLLGDYRAFLLGQRALTPETTAGYTHAVRPFIAARVHGEAVDLSEVTAADVTAFVLTACPGRSRGSAKLIVSALRSLLGWLFVIGRLDTDLCPAVPSVAGWRLAGLPKGLEPRELRRLLGVFDRRTTAGRRDFAMTLMMVRLGLRAGEVRHLGLDDIDWRAGELVIRGKGTRVERLPLPSDVGEAVAAYLRRDRPRTAQGRTVFVRVHAPHGPLSSGATTDVVCRAARRAGLGLVHAHVLRHTAATQMVRAGAALPEVGQVLGHRMLLTTVDLCEGRHRRSAGPGPPVAGERGMSPLHEHLADYLGLRRSLGYKLARPEKLLGQFISYLEERGADTVTVSHALAWARPPERDSNWWAHRLSVVRVFATYLHSIDERHEVPAADLLRWRGRRARSRRRWTRAAPSHLGHGLPCVSERGRMSIMGDREGATAQWEAARRDVANAKTEAEKEAAAAALKRAETRLDFEFNPQ